MLKHPVGMVSIYLVNNEFVATMVVDADKVQARASVIPDALRKLADEWQRFCDSESADARAEARQRERFKPRVPGEDPLFTPDD